MNCLLINQSKNNQKPTTPFCRVQKTKDHLIELDEDEQVKNRKRNETRTLEHIKRKKERDERIANFEKARWAQRHPVNKTVFNPDDYIKIGSHRLVKDPKKFGTGKKPKRLEDLQHFQSPKYEVSSLQILIGWINL
jgi:hypothetical protein